MKPTSKLPPVLEFSDGTRAMREWSAPILLRPGESTPIVIQNGVDRNDTDIVLAMAGRYNLYPELVEALKAMAALYVDCDWLNDPMMDEPLEAHDTITFKWMDIQPFVRAARAVLAKCEGGAE